MRVRGSRAKIDGLTMVAKTRETEGSSIVITVILAQGEKLFSCYTSLFHNDHGNREVHISSDATSDYVEVCDGDLMNGTWRTEIELQEVVKTVELVEVVKYVKV